MRSTKIAIIQSCYIPWKGYFDIINMVDKFVVGDELQYSPRSFRNRNIIKTPSGIKWLTIPVISNFPQKISEVKIADPKWARSHWSSIFQNYRQARHFGQYKDFFKDLYLGSSEKYLSEVNFKFLKAICQILDITTEITKSSDYDIIGRKAEITINICKQAGANEYLSGPAAQEYIDEDYFKENKIKLQWMNYSKYPDYEQLYPPFVHEVSILDMIFNLGKETKKYMKSFKG